MRMRILVMKMRKRSKAASSERSGVNTVRGFARALSLVAFLSFAAVHASHTGVAAAQTAKPSVDRTVVGTVVGKDDKPVAGAVVYLQNGKTMDIKSYLTDAAGRFHFGQLAQSTDYEIWAESNGERSKSKNISLYNSKDSFSFTLKLDKADK
jgi:hypothetical protein